MKVLNKQEFTLDQLALMIDHTLLKPTISPPEVKQLCNEAVQFKFGQICLPESLIAQAKKYVDHSNSSFIPKIAAVVGFPLGYESLKTKSFQSRNAIREGALEIDLVFNQAHFHSALYHLVLEELSEINRVCQVEGAILKVIIESFYLTELQLDVAIDLVANAKAAFIKTSTGFASPQFCPSAAISEKQTNELMKTGATTQVVKRMKEKADQIKSADYSLKIKASGGIKTMEQIKEFIALGADRIGTSSAAGLWSQLH